MNTEIKNWRTGAVIHAFEAPDDVSPERALGLAAQDAVRKGVSLAFADLRNADLSELFLFRAGLPDADISGACLRATALSEANLTRVRAVCVDAEFCCLDEAVLEDADFTGSDLSESIMVAAKCTRTNFSGALLVGADTENADFSGAILKGSESSGIVLASVWGDSADAPR